MDVQFSSHFEPIMDILATKNVVLNEAKIQLSMENVTTETTLGEKETVTNSTDLLVHIIEDVTMNRLIDSEIVSKIFVTIIKCEVIS